LTGLREKSQKMRATNIIVNNLLYFFIFLMSTQFSLAQSNRVYENWIITQFRKSLENKSFFLGEYIRRDFDYSSSKKNFLQLYRFSYGWDLSKNFTLYLGAGYHDFFSQKDEFRAHQFLFYQSRFDELQIQIVNRFGLEQRFFNKETQTGARFRNRIIINFLTLKSIGPSFYDEFFYVTHGAARFPSGLNENRFGYGIRLSYQGHQFYLYRSEAFLKTLKKRIEFEWWQFQAQFQF